MSEVEDPWERHASWWQETFTDGADPEYEEQILPLAVAWTAGFDHILEVGTGEGQVARAIAECSGSRVIGIDLSVNQIREARSRGGGVCGFARATALNLPFEASTFDAVLTCLVLEHVDDLDSAIGEVARVLRPGGRFVLLLNHPLLQTPGSGWIDDQVLEPPEQYWRIGPYLPETSTIEEVERDVFIRFVHRPLHRYLNALIDAGLSIERLLEPPPPSGFTARAPEYQDAATVPRLMLISARAITNDRG